MLRLSEQTLAAGQTRGPHVVLALRLGPRSQTRTRDRSLKHQWTSFLGQDGGWQSQVGPGGLDCCKGCTAAPARPDLSQPPGFQHGGAAKTG